MNTILRLVSRTCLAFVILGLPQVTAAQNKNTELFTQDFNLEDCIFASSGQNRYWVLQSGFQTVFRGLENGETVVNTITVTGTTRRIGSVTTRIVEERETHNGQLGEVSRNYFAICTQNDSVFYFGEDVDIYENNVIVSHEGSWLAGTNGAKPGLIMPGLVLLGSRYFQEVAPGLAMDQAEFVAMNQVLTTPAGTFRGCVQTKETTPLEPKAVEFKVYAPDIGLVQDDTLLLVRYGYVH